MNHQNVFGYIRTSTDKQIASTQKKSIKAYCDSQNWNLIEVFEDIGLSGKSTDRPAYQDMLSKLSECDLILVYRLDRLSRNLKDVLILVEDRLQPLSIGLKSVTEPFDSTTVEGRLMFQMLGSFAEFERKKITERMMSGKYRNAAHGCFNGSPVNFGYTQDHTDGTGFVIVPEEAEMVRELFKLYITGKYGMVRLKKITGCLLSPQGILKLLKNPLYVGKIKYNGLIRSGEHEAIVTEYTFNRAQKTIERRSKKRPLKNKHR